ncbi:MAG: lipid II flippase MurJ, partial [Patescibacteria group bacterium]|nr:lipid II flippase MurJ [Patescibacteria group bacterium]
LTPLLNRVFFALHNTKIPVIIGIISMIVNVIFCFLFTYLLSFSNMFQTFFQNALKLQDIQNIEIIGLVLALSLAVFLQTILLLIFLYKKIGDFKIKEILFSLTKILFASALMVVAVYFVREIVDKFVDMQTFIGVLWQAALSSLIGAFVYFSVSLFLKSPEIKIIKLSFFKQFNKK